MYHCDRCGHELPSAPHNAYPDHAVEYHLVWSRDSSAFDKVLCVGCGLDVFTEDDNVSLEHADTLVTVVLQPDGTWLAARLELGRLDRDALTSPPCGSA